MISLLDESPRVAAARIALLELRARLAREQTPPNRFRLPDAGGALEVESAAVELSRLPQPLVLDAEVVDGAIVVRRSPEAWLAENVYDRALFRRQARRRPEPYETLPVCCIGAGEALLVTAGAADAWRRGYVAALPGGYHASPPAIYLGQHPHWARQAYEAGAVGIIRFHFPTAPGPEDTGDVIVLSGRGPDQPRVLEHEPGDAPCALCRASAAEWRETATWKQPWRERRLCSRCVAARLGPRAVQKARALDEWYRELTPLQHRELEDRIAGEVRHVVRPFRHLPTPPELAAFVDRWRHG